VSIRTSVTKTLLAAGVLLLASVPPAQAAVLTYTEIIEDSLIDPFSGRDLTRHRTFGNGTTEEIFDDTTIVSENAVSDGWGHTSLFPFVPQSLNHLFIADSVTSFLSATLTIEAFGATGLDLIFVDFLFPVGVLDASGTTVVSTDSIFGPPGDPFRDAIVNAVLAALLGDGSLNVNVLPLFPNIMSIHRSTLSVTYEAPVPEPSVAVLMLGALLAVGGRTLLRKRRA
jgi:hypothetical protein